MIVTRHSVGAFALIVGLLAPPRLGASEPREDRRLADAVSAIVRADYRGDRAELLRQAEALGAAPSKRNAAYREYWIGFAYWRRAINGFNEVPPPEGLLADLRACAAHQRAALALDARLEDAQSALSGCLAGQMYLSAQLSAEERTAVLKEGVAAVTALKERPDPNPRSLWILGGFEAFAPRGADPMRAAATYRRGLAAARAEALSTVRKEPWVPVWGAPEILMSLAYLNNSGPKPDRAVARAYAEAALAMVPDWHYMKDVLLPQIEKAEDPAAATAASAP